jgi:hypothetical protein
MICAFYLFVPKRNHFIIIIALSTGLVQLI